MRKKIIGVLMLFLVFFTFVSCGPASEEPVKYKVTYVTEHGTTPAEVVNVDQLPSSLPVLTADNYIFNGWYYDVEHNRSASGGDKIENDTILYAQWILREADKFIITYVTNGHGSNQAPVINVTKLPDTLPLLEETGFDFEGWYYDAAFKEPATGGETITKDTTLYAKWTPIDLSNLDPYDPEVSLQGLEIISNGNNVVYFGDVFTAEGYDISVVLTKANPLDPESPFYKTIKVENFSIDDSRVNYYQEGTYNVTIQARYLRFVAQETTKITVKADRYEDLGVKHLFAVKCAEQIEAASAADVRPSEVYAIYTENEYKNGELVLIEERKRSGYELSGVEDIDFTKAGRYVVYLSLTESYGTTTITVKTFFVVVVK